MQRFRVLNFDMNLYVGPYVGVGGTGGGLVPPGKNFNVKVYSKRGQLQKSG